MTAFEVLSRLATAYHWKEYYFEQQDGSIYSRQCHGYLTLEEAIDEFAEVINGTEGATNLHVNICRELIDLYNRKNHDYGDSFHKTFEEEGLAMCRIRMNDKLERFKTLSRGEESQVRDESMEDTLLDLANYAIMTLMELRRSKGES